MKIRLTNSEYVMVDIPQEITPQGLYGLIKRLKRIQNFFSEGDTFSLKGDEDSAKSENGAVSMRKSRKNSPFRDIMDNREIALKEVKKYYTEGENYRREIAKKYNTSLSNYSGMIAYVRKKWNIMPKEAGVETFNLYKIHGRINGK
jgi:hypothetical protein